MRTLFYLLPLIIAPAFVTRAADVDAAIVFAIDVSASIDQLTAKMQRDGHVAALSEPSVMAAIVAGRRGCIAIAYIEWSSAGKAWSVLPWTTICSRADAFAAANAIRKDGAARGRCEGYCATSISNAIDVSSALLEQFDGSAGSKIIDISASGTNNDGPPVALSRQRALGRGHIINAIAPPQLRFGIPYHYLEYMTRNVIGGTGSFAVEPSAARDYAWTLRWKFQKEISSSGAPAGAYEVASDLVPARAALRPFWP